MNSLFHVTITCHNADHDFDLQSSRKTGKRFVPRGCRVVGVGVISLLFISPCCYSVAGRESRPLPAGWQLGHMA